MRQQTGRIYGSGLEKRLPRLGAALLCATFACVAQTKAQTSAQTLQAQEPIPDAQQQIRHLSEAVARSEAQLESSQREIRELRHAVDALQDRLTRQASVSASDDVAPINVPPGSSVPYASSSSRMDAQTNPQDLDELRERQAIQQAEITTQEQAKVETESKFPLRLTGMILLNGFINSGAVDLPATPTFALAGAGSSGASLRQTVVGLNANGPHLFGARTTADLRMDFYGSGTSATYSSGPGLVRLRTAHAALLWNRTELFFSLDRPILSPETPTSLTSVALPALAWSGNLWNWNPQIGVRYGLPVGPRSTIQVEAALIASSDPPNLTSTAASTILPYPSSAERSSRPGVEAHIALLRSGAGASASDGSSVVRGGASLGIGGYFSPHRTSANTQIHAWAGTLDFRLPLPGRLQLTGSAFRGAALGGLGAGGYKDFVSRTDSLGVHVRVLDDVGGWIQLKQRVTERLEWNAAYGIDNVFSRQLRPFATYNLASYADLARNRTFFTNLIYTPSSAVTFSFEYRHLQSSPVDAYTSSANVYGAAAAYKF